MSMNQQAVVVLGKLILTKEHTPFELGEQLAEVFDQVTAESVIEDLRKMAEYRKVSRDEFAQMKFMVCFFSAPTDYGNMLAFFPSNTDFLRQELPDTPFIMLYPVDLGAFAPILHCDKGQQVTEEQQFVVSIALSTIRANKRTYTLDAGPDYEKLGKMIDMRNYKGMMDTSLFSEYLNDVCWEPEAVRAVIDKAASDLAFPYGNAQWAVVLLDVGTFVVRGQLKAPDQQFLLQMYLEFALQQRGDKIKIAGLVRAHPYDLGNPGLGYKPPRMQPPAGYNPGALYGPGPYGYNSSRPAHNQIDLTVTTFDEVKPYFEILEKEGFDVAHEAAIFETIMENSCGSNGGRHYRFRMTGYWGNVSEGSARLMLETRETNHENVPILISVYQTGFGLLFGLPPHRVQSY